MEIQVKDSCKIVEVWLSNEEKQDRTLLEGLKPLYEAYRERNYTVAVFASGGGDLYEGTRDLLRYNRDRLV